MLQSWSFFFCGFTDTELVQVNFRSAVYDLNEVIAAVPIIIDFVDSNGQPTAINEAFELSKHQLRSIAHL